MTRKGLIRRKTNQKINQPTNQQDYVNFITETINFMR